jgi:hypothetical protein
MSKRIFFFAAAVILAGAGIFFRASNSHTARIQADQIVAADKAGTDTAAALASLQAFVKTHMGSSVKITLQYSYDRAQAAAKAAAAAAPSGNSQIYADAQRACGGKSDSITQARCVTAYVTQRLTNAPVPTPVPAPKLTDYQYNLKAPLWTPDLAGALLLGAAAAAGFGLILRKTSF